VPRRRTEPERRTIMLPGGTEYVEGVVGYRAWGVHVESGVATLRSVVMTKHSWTPGAPVVAECAWGGEARHPAPASGCDCGVFGFSLASLAYQAFPERTTLHGEVILWGTIRLHEFGYRAEYAIPAALYLPEPLVSSESRAAHQRIASLAADRYDVPLVQRPRGLVAYR